MPDTSTILSLPYILPAQAQKHVTHNEALRLLDVIVQLAVLDRNRTAPPGGAAEGQRHIVAAGATGDWAGQSGRLAVFQDGAWQFLAPLTGWQAWIGAEAKAAVWDGAAWVVATGGLSSVDQLGISTTADATNRLAVASPASLFGHAGAGHRLKINKAAAGDTASLALQTAGLTRAEIGTIAGNDLTLKVSPDGTSFQDAVTVAAATGIVSLPQGADAGTFSLRDPADVSKRALWSLTALSTGTTRSYALPDVSGTLAVLGASSQTFTGATTVSGTFTASAALVSLGTATAASTANLGSGATAAAATKTVNIGTGGVSGSTTVINLGSAVAGAGGALVVNSPTVTFAGSVTALAAPAAAVSVNTLGVGGAAGDATNRLSLNAPASLFNHAGAGHQVKLNKAAATDTASLAFQTGFSGRAEIGTTGSDDLAIKVSADGTSFQTALTVARATAQVSLPQPLLLAGQASDPASPANGTIWLNTTTGQLRLRTAGATVTAGGVADGARGDITVSGGGTAWAVAPAAKYGLPVALGQLAFFN